MCKVYTKNEKLLGECCNKNEDCKTELCETDPGRSSTCVVNPFTGEKVKATKKEDNSTIVIAIGCVIAVVVVIIVGIIFCKVCGKCCFAKKDEAHKVKSQKDETAFAEDLGEKNKTDVTATPLTD